MNFSTHALLRHHMDTLLRCLSVVVGDELDSLRVCRAVLVNADYLFTTAARIQKIVLLIEEQSCDT